MALGNGQAAVLGGVGRQLMQGHSHCLGDFRISRATRGSSTKPGGSSSAWGIWRPCVGPGSVTLALGPNTVERSKKTQERVVTGKVSHAPGSRSRPRSLTRYRRASPLGDINLGYYFCHLNRTRDDLAETLVPYSGGVFRKAGHTMTWAIHEGGRPWKAWEEAAPRLRAFAHG